MTGKISEDGDVIVNGTEKFACARGGVNYGALGSSIATWLASLPQTLTNKTIVDAALIGSPTAPTPLTGDNDTSVATTAFVAAAVASATGTAYPPGALYGSTLSNNVTSPNTKLDISSQSARDIADTSNIVLAATLTKTLNVAWAVGNAGGLDTGAVAATKWYFVFLIKRLDTNVVDALFSLSPTAPVMPSSYTIKRRIGAIKTDAGSNILAFYQVPGTGEFFWRTASKPRDMSNVTITTTPTKYTLASIPLGIKVRVKLLVNATGTSTAIVSDPDLGAPPDTTYAVVSAPNFAVVDIWADLAAQVYVFIGLTTSTFNLWVQGWYDPRDAAL